MIKAIRVQGYIAGLSGLALAGIGVLITQAIAAGVIEGKLIPDLKKAVKKHRADCEEVCNVYDKLTVDADELLKFVEEEKTKLLDFHKALVNAYAIIE